MFFQILTRKISYAALPKLKASAQATCNAWGLAEHAVCCPWPDPPTGKRCSVQGSATRAKSYLEVSPERSLNTFAYSTVICGQGFCGFRTVILPPICLILAIEYYALIVLIYLSSLDGLLEAELCPTKESSILYSRWSLKTEQLYKVLLKFSTR